MQGLKRQKQRLLALFVMSIAVCFLVSSALVVCAGEENDPIDYELEEAPESAEDDEEVYESDEMEDSGEPVDLYYEDTEHGTTLIVDDSEHLYSDAEIRSFRESAAGVLKFSNVLIVTAAKDDYQGYSKSLVDYYFGNGTNSTSFLINMNPRMIYIFSEGSVKNMITGDVANSITDNIYRQASLGAYYACAEKALSLEATVLSGGHIFEPMKYIGNFFAAFLMAILLTFGLTFWLQPKVKKEAIAGIDKVILGAMAAGIVFSFLDEQRIYDPVKSDSDSSSGGGGGGGDSGAGGGHSF